MARGNSWFRRFALEDALAITFSPDDSTEGAPLVAAIEGDPGNGEPPDSSKGKAGGLIVAGKLDENGIPSPDGGNMPRGYFVSDQTPGGSGEYGGTLVPPIVITGRITDIMVGGDPADIPDPDDIPVPDDSDNPPPPADVSTDPVLGWIPMVTMSGTSRGEYIVSAWPRVTMYGYGGDDVLIAFGIENIIYGGSGDDVIRGAGGINRLYGQVGDDLLLGYGVDNRLFGGLGNDTLVGVGLFNELRGESGDDTLRGLGTTNLLSGGAGNDRVFGYGAKNTLLGGLGDDRLVGLGVINVADGGLGRDIVVGLGGTNTLRGGDGSDAVFGLAGFNKLYGDGDKDLLVGGGLSARLYGGDARDLLIGSGLFAELNGDTGNDILFANALVNILRGGADWDILIANGFASNNLDGGGGRDLVVSIEQPQTSILKTLTNPLGIIGPSLGAVFGINVVTGGNGGDVVVVTSIAGFAYGGAGNDLVIGTGMGVRLEGEGGNDRLFSVALGANLIGGEGNDIIIGITYRLSIPTGTGINIPVPGVQVLQGGAGNDLLLGHASGLTIGPALIGKATKTKKIADIVDPEKSEMESLKAIFSTVQLTGFTPGDKNKKLEKEMDKLFDENIEKLLNALPSIQFQFAGSDNDVAISLGQAGVQFGQEGSDILVALADRNIAFGGDGDDLILMNTALLNFASGGDGNDWILDLDVFGRLMLNSLEPDRPIELLDGLLGMFSEYLEPILEFKATLDQQIDDLLDPARKFVTELSTKVDDFADELKQAALDLTNIDEILATLGGFFDAMQDFIEELRDVLNLELPESRGGAGNDVLATSATDSIMVGGEGNDTYLFMFGRGDHAIEDIGTVEQANAKIETLLAIAGYGDEIVVKQEVQTFSGGTDTLEIYGENWLDVVDLDTLGFEKVGDDLKIFFIGNGNKPDPERGSITLRDMDENGARIEVLRVQTDNGFETFDLEAAWLADAFAADSFDFEDWRMDTVATSPTETAFEVAFGVWSDTVDAISGQDMDLASIRDFLDTGAQDVVDIINNTAPDSFDFA